MLERVTYGAEAAAAAGKTDLEQLFAVFEILVQCALKYPALTRRIAYLNALEDSTLYHCFRPCFEVVYSRIDLAHAQGTFRRDVDRFTILETMLGIFYVVLYHWDYIYPDQEQKIHDRLQVVFYTHLGPYLTPQAK